MNTSDTPRTDAVWLDPGIPYQDCYAESQSLERELKAANKELSDIRAEVFASPHQNGNENILLAVRCLVDQVDEHFRELQTEREKVRKLKEALELICNHGGKEYDDVNCNGAWCADQAREAVGL